jgi:hypothetical protein
MKMSLVCVLKAKHFFLQVYAVRYILLMRSKVFIVKFTGISICLKLKITSTCFVSPAKARNIVGEQKVVDPQLLDL